MATWSGVLGMGTGVCEARPAVLGVVTWCTCTCM